MLFPLITVVSVVKRCDVTPPGGVNSDVHVNDVTRRDVTLAHCCIMGVRVNVTDIGSVTLRRVGR